MKTLRFSLPVLAALIVVPESASAQIRASATAAAFYESYSFDQGLVFREINELTVPVGLNLQFGSRAGLAVSTGYVRVELKSANTDILPNQEISGGLDTQFRFSYAAIPGRLVFFGTGTAPTGTKTVNNQETSILGVITSDLIGFTSSTVGTGGAAGAGFAGAVPVGRWALGLGGTFNNSFNFRPVTNSPKLEPGAEFRIRTGLEGPLARRTYLRFAGIFARRGKDKVGGVTQNGVGNRWIGYLSLNQGFGRTSLVIYLFDVFRSEPQLTGTVVGAAFLPKGNLIAVGGRVDFPLGRSVVFTPRAEYRYSTQATGASGGGSLEKLGTSIRFGANIRFQTSRNTAVVLQGSGITGDVVQGSTEVGFDGYRASLHLEITP